MKINAERLKKNLYELAEIGKNQYGGIDRALGSRADSDARKWLVSYWENHLSLPLRIDSIANMWIHREGEENLPPIVFGSHHDTVPNGGMFDGAMGVLIATEIMEYLNEKQIKTRHPLEIVSFTGEEPNPYNVSTLGSKVLSGRMKKEELQALKSGIDGSPLQDCMLQIGGDIEHAQEDFITEGKIGAFLECHIEQGRRLADMDKSVSAVSRITGIYRENITIAGDANHAGTTIMNDRQDALAGASELILSFEKLLKSYNSTEVVGTVGYLSVFPNSANIIPGEVSLILEIRTVEPAIRDAIISRLEAVTEQIENSRHVTIHRKVNLKQEAVYMDDTVWKAVLEAMKSENQEAVSLVSMAGHDAANMQRVTKAGMVFVKSVNGKSHCPSEYSQMKDIAIAADVMMAAIMILDRELD